MTHQQPPLYHGTRAAFRGSGGLLLPGTCYDRDNHGLGRSDYVYMTPDRDEAAMWARAAQGRGRPRILTVMPMSPVEDDDSTVLGDEHQGVRCREGCRVLAVQIIPEQDPDDEVNT